MSSQIVIARINSQKYSSDFAGKEADAFKVALEARRFEIQMYWTRTAYFWTLTGAALAGFFALEAQQKADHIFPFAVACVGAVLSLGWSLANKGSKYWHENWEHQVQLLEDSVVGPLHKTIVYRPEEPFKLRHDYFAQLLTGPANFSVSKINAVFSWFFMTVWMSMIYIITPKCSPFITYSVDYRYALIGAVAVIFFFGLFKFGRSWLKDQEHWARRFDGKII